MRRIATFCALTLCLANAGWVTASETVRTEAAGLRFAVPPTWVRTLAPSDVRAAQYRIPRAASDSEDPELIMFFFGNTKGGGVQENLDRWYAQFTQPDGSPSRDAAVLTIRTVKGLRVTAVDLSGSYTGMQPRTDPKPGYRMLAAVVEGKGGPWFFKVVGPQASMAQAKDELDAMLLSLEPHG